MNFTDIKSRPCRIMWSQRDPSLRKSGVGNVFVKNLAPTVDNKGLFDTFSVFGNILSCKVATDDSGNSKGYGYVHYETAEAAQDAIQKFNGNFIDDLEVHVGPFVRRQDRAGQNDWTNLYVKQFPVSWDETRLKDLFAVHGQVASVMINKDADGKSKGFGFVNYVDHASAEKAVTEMANKTFDDPLAVNTPASEDGTEPAVETPTTFELYVNRAQKKTERTREIKIRLDAMNHERVSKYQGMNLYVKNLDDTISDELFRETFAAYGTITSARIMRDAVPPVAEGAPPASPTAGASKGFGFICYSSPEEATRAVTEMNGKIIRSKPIVVTLHQRKDLRRAHLAQTYAPRMMRTNSYPQGPGGVPMYPGMGMYGPQSGPGQGGFNQQRGGSQPYPYPAAGGNQSFSPRGGGAPRGMPFAAGGRGSGPGFYPMPAYGIPPQQGQQMMPGGAMPGQANNFKRAPNGQPIPGAPMNQGGMSPNGGGPQGFRAGGRSTPTGRGSMGMAGPTGSRGMMMGGQGQMPMMGGQQMGMQMGGRGAPAASVKFNSNVRNQGQGGMMQSMGGGQQQSSQSSMVPGLGEPLDDQALAAADPQMQKNMIGERLYPLIYVHQPALAGKITGMLLEMDNAELLNLIESPDSLMSKIDEALIVLKNHQSGGPDEQ